MSYGVTLEVWGDLLCCSRPELKVERLSYECLTPSAARGILESIYWHPPMQYRIDRIHVLNPIRFLTIRKNELKSKALASSMRSAIAGKGLLPYINTKQDIQQRTSTILTNVRYVIEAHFDVDESKMEEGDTPAKFISILNRRIQRGQCWQQPYLGIREFAASFAPYSGAMPPRGYYSDSGERDLGLMLYDMDYSNPKDITPMFFRAVMINGVIDVAGSEVYR
ncbi:MAG: type I-C CRISPR-associated protein Cas5 [Atopobiaceae bacterium]|nr:type I-C CRISPR-associated protein Cas5 [Atopobiaceae bacterium]